MTISTIIMWYIVAMRKHASKILAILVVVLALITAFFAYQDWQASHGDLNHDGRVDLKDLSILAKHYGKKD